MDALVSCEPWMAKARPMRQYMEYGEEPHSAADSVQSHLEGDKGIGLKATWNQKVKTLSASLASS